jgi:predicted Ser/Thr protein kinase
VVVAVGVGATAAIRWADEPGVSVSAGPGSVSTAAQFDRAADELCQGIDRGLNGIDPRFATSEAYVVIARSRVEVIATARSALLSIRPADDTRRRVASASAASALHSAAAAAETVRARARASDIDGATSALEQTDGQVRDAVEALADLGIHECRVAASN